MRLKTALKNFLIKAVVPKKNKTPPPYKRFLIISTTALGDTLWATPAITSLRLSFPDSFIAVLTSPLGKQALVNNPHIDKILTVKEPVFYRFPFLLYQLKKLSFDVAVFFHASQRLILPLCSFLKIPIYGTPGSLAKGLDTLFSHFITPRPTHEIERRLALVEAVGGKEKSYLLEYHSTEEEKEYGKKFFTKHHLDPSALTIALHPGAKELFRCWPKENFIALGEALKNALPCQILITGNQKEKDLVLEIASSIGARAIPTIEKMSVREFAAILEKVDLLISNDTGPAHLASSLQRASLTLFSPTHPRTCGPYKTEKGSIIKKPRTCTPCLRKKCREPFCMLQISTHEVLEKALSLLQNPLKN